MMHSAFSAECLAKKKPRAWHTKKETCKQPRACETTRNLHREKDQGNPKYQATAEQGKEQKKLNTRALYLLGVIFKGVILSHRLLINVY